MNQPKIQNQCQHDWRIDPNNSEWVPGINAIDQVFSTAFGAKITKERRKIVCADCGIFNYQIRDNVDPSIKDWPKAE